MHDDAEDWPMNVPKVPRGQDWQAEEEELPGVGLYVPAGQGMAEEDPRGQKEPGGHVVAMTEPAGQ